MENLKKCLFICFPANVKRSQLLHYWFLFIAETRLHDHGKSSRLVSPLMPDESGFLNI
jgi:hypothetical protein